MDWAAIFDPSLPVPETVLRGTVIFLGLTLLLRLAGQRESGSLARAKRLHRTERDDQRVPEGRRRNQYDAEAAVVLIRCGDAGVRLRST